MLKINGVYVLQPVALAWIEHGLFAGTTEMNAPSRFFRANTAGYHRDKNCFV